MGAILAQKDKYEKKQMISVWSKAFDKCQINYAATDKELLVVVKGIENHIHFLLGKPFVLKTDRKTLTCLWVPKNSTGRILR